MSNNNLDRILQTITRDPEATMSARAVAEVILRLQADIEALQRRVADMEIAEKQRIAA